jgi:glycosyltransferase involved in cell wall biosynthesis
MYSVSVIIPIFNTSEYIERCARSIMEQTLANIEYIFVDDCTPDNSMDILDAVLSEYPDRRQNIKILHHPMNKGLSAARNTGLDNATGEYIGWVDSDDWVEKNMFEKMYAAATEQHADIVCCDIFRDSLGGQSTEKYPYNVEKSDDVFSHIEGGIYSAVWNKIVRRTLYEENQIRALEGISMWEDLAVTLRLRYYSKLTLIVPDTLYHYNNAVPSSMSINYNNSLKGKYQKLMCANFLYDYFSDKRLPSHYWHKLMELCFGAKEFLFYPPVFDFYTWKSKMSESNRYIMSYSSIPFVRRMKYVVFNSLAMKFSNRILSERYHLISRNK